MTSKAEEAGASSSHGPQLPTPAPRPSLHSPPLPPPPISNPSIFLTSSGSLGGWPESGRGARGAEVEEGLGEKSHAHTTLRQLARASLVMAAIIFLSQLVMAGCLCRPVVVMGGLWLGVLVLIQSILTLRASAHAAHPAPPPHSSHALLVGATWVSGVVSVICLGGAAYLFSGHLTLACISAFHRPDHASVVRLYVVEVVGLVASLPCLTAAILSLISAALSARAAYPPKPKPEGPVVLYLPRWGDAVYGSDQQTLPQSRPGDAVYGSDQQTLPQSRPGPVHAPHPTPRPALPPPLAGAEGAARNNTPPPSYNQVAEESYA